MFEEAGHAVDALRSSLPFAYLFVFPVLILVISPVAVVDAAHEFSVYRMQQYDLQGKSYGCRSSYTNMEARSVDTPATALTRKCLIMRAKDLTYDIYREAISNYVGTILVFLPKNMSQFERENFMSMEFDMLELQPNVPVYFTYEDEDLTELYDQFEGFAARSGAGSAMQSLISSATSVGYQMVTKGSAKPNAYNHKIINIAGMLQGSGIVEQLPTIAIVAHYDAFGVAPHLAQGANSDATGVVALLEIARIMKTFYNDPKTHPKYNVIFLLSGGGKFNYQGTKKWIEDGLENPTSEVLNLVANIKVAICLDALSSPIPELNMHVSKPPHNQSVAHAIYTHVLKLSVQDSLKLDVDMIHKKIRLSADRLAWEHERFSIRRLPAVTFSALSSHEDKSRYSIMDTRESVNINVLMKNINVLASAIVHQMYNISSESMRLNQITNAAQRDSVVSVLNFLTAQPRPQQAMTVDHPVIKTLENTLGNFADQIEVSSFKSDESEQDFKFYDALEVQMSASIVRSAVFDLYLSAAIASYTAIMYFVVLNFESFRVMAKKMSTIPKVKAN